ncbi:MAG: FAD-dependent oxidoreductase [Gammaproteobacteria bacterium]|nr:FAD-dependent oxidoreductase [Gammaproteobacteria bacterium]
MSYSIFSLVRNATGYHQNWQKAWRSPAPKREYDVIIIGAGGHGLGAAYYLARDHGITNIAVLEKGWLGGGNTARNTMTIRDNYIRSASVPFHRESMKLWRGLSRELNFNLMLHERGMITFLQSSSGASHAQRMVHTMDVFDSEYVMLSLDELKRRVPFFRDTPRMPIIGGVYHRKIAMARHDAVAWGYARAADRHGVDIIQNCEVTGILRQGNRVAGVDTSRGVIKAKKIGMAVAGHGSVVAAMAGIHLPVETWPLQALVSTPVKPVLNEIFVIDGFQNSFIMQSDKGELVMGSETDPYPSYAQRGSPQITEKMIEALMDVFPLFKRMKFMRQWAGMLDITYDNSPIISSTDLKGFYIDVAGSGGFKTTPIAAKMHADLIANERPHPLIAEFGLNRFQSGRLLVEGGVDANR